MLALIALATTAFAANIDTTIHKVESMVWDADVTALAARHGLGVMNVTWEDTGRWKGSSVGPNISDMTIGVRDSGGYLHPMPVVRFDNFNDKTADIAAEHFVVPMGNAQGRTLRPLTLDRVLKNTRAFLHDSTSWEGREWSLWSERDDEVLVSAQACFLPVPKTGEATFTPVIYNYQSYPGNPAVLTIVATREGTSIQVVENEGGYMSQPLFFNQDGQRAPYTAVRQSDFEAGTAGIPELPSGPISAAGEDAANVVLIIQVPLVQKALARQESGTFDMPMGAIAGETASRSARSDVENAVIGHGDVEGPFTEINDLAIERDTRFPVRVTVQFYKATSNGVVSERDLADIRAQIDRVYSDASYVGSLVTEGWTGRSTEWVEPPPRTATARWAAPNWGGLKAW